MDSLETLYLIYAVLNQRPRTDVTFVAQTATPTLDFIATKDAAPTEQHEDVLHGQPWPMDAYDDGNHDNFPYVIALLL